MQIQYNLLNLPSKTTFSDGGSINYQYSASGMKQMVWGSAPGQGSKSQFYLGNYVYGNGVKQLLVDGGYVTFSGTTPQYHFYVKDHLGNNRMVVNANGTVEQVNHYYAFGGLMGEGSGSDVQDFKYNGKELDRLHGLDWYDYGARMYDAATGKFFTIDPVAKKYYNISPYAYCGNNPIRRIDPTGMVWEDPKEAEELKKNIDKRISQLEKSNKKIESKMASGKLSKRKLEKLSDRQQENNAMISNLKQSVNDIDKLGADAENTYAFRQIDGGAHHVVKEDGVVYIETSSDAFSIHEITHIRQSLNNGGLQFDKSNRLKNIGNNFSGEKKYEILTTAEVEAYKQQYSYQPSSYVGRATSLNDVNAASVGGIINDRGNFVYDYINVWLKFTNQRNYLIGR